MAAASGVARRGGDHWWSSRLDREQVKWAFVFILPWVIGFLVFTAGPMIWSFYLSFTSYDPFRGDPQVIGTRNYEMLLADPRAKLALQNTLYFTVFNVPGTIIIGLGLAMMLNRMGRSSGFFRTLFYLPNVTPAVAIGALFFLLLDGHGIIHQGLRAIGIQNPPFWLTK